MKVCRMGQWDILRFAIWLPEADWQTVMQWTHLVANDTAVAA